MVGGLHGGLHGGLVGGLVVGLVPPSIAALWHSGSVRAFGKPSGGIRPIALFECPLKFATGCILDAHRTKLSRTLSPYQFGAMLNPHSC